MTTHLHRAARLLLLALLLSTLAVSQQPEASDRLLLENEFVRLRSLAISPDTRALSSTLDSVFVLPNDASVTVAATEDQPTSSELLLFVPSGASRTLRAQTPSATAFLIELKKHWEAPMKPCSETAMCSRTIRAGGMNVGETRTIFSNGFVTGVRHSLDRGATLSSSYFSAKGEDRILLLPLTPLRATFDGAELEFKAGQPYFAMAKDVEVSADSARAVWIVIRLHQPRTASQAVTRP